MADPEARNAAVARAHQRISDIIPIGLSDWQLDRLADVLSQAWDDGYGHGRDDEADGQPDVVLAHEDRIRDAMAEATDNPGRIVTR